MTDFQRFHAGYVGRTGVPVGVFVAVDHLRRCGRLSEEEIVLYACVDAWFQENLPNPPFYDDGNSIGAVTWFRDGADGMTDHLRPLLSILDSKGVAWVRSVSADPGRIVYEDQWQIGVVPSSRLDLTPLPYPGELGPSDWFEVREGIGRQRHSAQPSLETAVATAAGPSDASIDQGQPRRRTRLPEPGPD